MTAVSFALCCSGDRDRCDGHADYWSDIDAMERVHVDEMKEGKGFENNLRNGAFRWKEEARHEWHR
jgi:hypothetical protein